jgi:hypothetical protein
VGEPAPVFEGDSVAAFVGDFGTATSAASAFASATAEDVCSAFFSIGFTPFATGIIATFPSATKERAAADTLGADLLLSRNGGTVEFELTSCSV